MRSLKSPVVAASFALSLGLIAGCNNSSSGAGTSGSASASSSSAPSTAASTAAVVAAAASGSAGAAGSTTLGAFEGTVAARITTTQMQQPMNVMLEIKADKMRFDLDSMFPGMPPVWGILDRKSNKLSTVMDAQKMVMVMDLGAAAKAGAAAASAAAPMASGAPKTPTTLDKTAKTDTVAGQACEIWYAANATSKTELCVVKGVQALNFGMLGKGAGADVSWSDGLDAEGAMPLRAIVYDATGKETMRAEATSITKKALDDSRFQIPAGYTTMNGTGGIPGLGGMKGGAMPAIPGMPGTTGPKRF